MLAGIFATKNQKTRGVSSRGAQQKRKKRQCPLAGRITSERFETERPLCTAALLNIRQNDYGLAGGAMAGDASAAGDAIAPLSSVVFL
jgi:hypothetical protein